MPKPTVSDTKPMRVKLEDGNNYYFCGCGKSNNQPFCDASHAGTGIKPQAFKAEKDGPEHLCLCKQSANPPFCDGSHTQVPSDMVGQEFQLERKSDMPEARPTPEEPTVAYIHQLAREGLSHFGSHGPIGAMGVPSKDLPHWNDIQIMVAQMAQKPLLDDAAVDTRLIIGPEAKKPLKLDIPLFVSDMSFGALSEEAKVAMSKGAELAGTGICSGEGGMLPEEQQANSRYFYELASAEFGYNEALLSKVQAFHFKGGQGAKTGIGGHLPGEKNVGKISQVRGIEAGTPAVSPATFSNLHTVDDFRAFGDRVRELTDGIPIGFKLSANHIERDVEFALQAGADYIILDGRGGGTGAAPLIFRDHISVPSIPALARARRYLDQQGASGRVTLIVTGGLRVPPDFVKAMALGADGIALANSAMQAIGCVGARICNTNNCPAGIATQKPELRQRLQVDRSAEQLARFLSSSVDLMKVMARACGHDRLSAFNRDDIATWHYDLARLSDIPFTGIAAIED